MPSDNIWVEFTSAIKARHNHTKAKPNWWTYRDVVQLVPKTVAEQTLENIMAEQKTLLALLPEWERPGSGKALLLASDIKNLALEVINNVKAINIRPAKKRKAGEEQVSCFFFKLSCFFLSFY
jgi:hypothetical protein